MSEYMIYFATVSGLLKIRWGSQPLRRDLDVVSYRTPILNPLIFCGVSGLITIQSALSHWLSALFICCLLTSGTITFKSSWWQAIVTRNSANDIS